MKKKSLLFLGIFLACFLLIQPSYSQDKLRIASLGGNLLWAPQRYAAEFEQRTGIKIETIGISYDDLYDTLMKSFKSGKHEYDIIIYAPLWSHGIMGGGYVAEVPGSVKEAIEWSDILPLFQERLVSWDGKTYALSYDGDIMMLYYRKDIFNDPDNKKKFRKKYSYNLDIPKTWEEYRDIAEFFTGWDWNGDGANDYGMLEAVGSDGQSYWNFVSRATAYFNLPGDPNVYFDDKTMKPLINNPGYVKALENYIEIIKYGPPGVERMQIQDIRPRFLQGNAAMCIDWGDTGTGTYSPESKVKGKVGSAMLPGSKTVWNEKKAKWENYPKINYAPFNTFGGWVASVTSSSPLKAQAFDFLTLVLNKESSLKNVTFPGTPCNPYRYSHFENIDAWVKAGFDEATAKEYLKAIKDGLDHPNLLMDMRIPGYEEYFQTLDLYIAKAIRKELAPKEALDTLAQEWEKITEKYGRDEQIKMYRSSLGIK